MFKTMYVRVFGGKILVRFSTKPAEKKQKWEKALPFLAIFISVFSLAFSVWQGIQTQQHNRLSLTPKLLVGQFGILTPPFGIKVRNDGSGLAKVVGIDINYDKKSYDSIRELRDALIQKFPAAAGSISYVEINSDSYYRVGQDFNVLEASGKIPEDVRASIWNDMLGLIQINIKYCSVYDECDNYACLNAVSEDCARQFPLSKTFPY